MGQRINSICVYSLQSLNQTRNKVNFQAIKSKVFRCAARPKVLIRNDSVNVHKIFRVCFTVIAASLDLTAFNDQMLRLNAIYRSLGNDESRKKFFFPLDFLSFLKKNNKDLEGLSLMCPGNDENVPNFRIYFQKHNPKNCVYF